MNADEPETLLERMPRHRARRRSPLRSDRGPQGPSDRPTPDPFARPVTIDVEAAAALAEGMRAVAEVADLALTATALILRELESKLPRHGKPDTREG